VTGNVHVGNVVEFHRSQLPAGLGDGTRAMVTAGDEEYASAAPLYTTDPGLVVLPEFDGEPWWEHQARLLRWEHFTPVVVPGAAGITFPAIADHPGLHDKLMAGLAAGATLVAWGESAGYRDFVRDLPADQALRSTGPDVPGRVESKVTNAEVFAEVHARLGAPAGIRLARQQLCTTEAELRAELAAAGRRGDTVALKAPYGVGGYGTAVLPAAELLTPAQVGETLADLRRADEFHRALPTIVQEFQWRSAAPWSDLSGDLTVDAAGRVEFHGVTAMMVEGTVFYGGISDDGTLLPPGRSELVTDFCMGVGEVVAGLGYRGWLDVDFLVRASGEVVPLEINARRSGGTAPLCALHRAEQIRGTTLTVAYQDVVGLPRRLPSRQAYDCFAAAVAGCGLAGEVVPTLVAGTAAVRPYLGVAVLGRGPAAATRRLATVKDAVVAAVEHAD